MKATTSISLLQQWLSPHYLEKDFLSRAVRTFSLAKPFPHLILRDFLLPEKLSLIEKALSLEKFQLKDADLFTFFQTNDLVGTKNKVLQEFRTFLCSPEFVSLISSITGVELINNKIDLAGTLYTLTHHLLTHDDQVEKRRVAFMLYFSSLEKKEGGALALYNRCDGRANMIQKRIFPRRNTFIFFMVSKVSFHEVEEVISAKERIALSGWFYDQ